MRTAIGFLLVLLLPVAPLRASGRVVAGKDVAFWLPPAGAVVEPYENAGYSLRFTNRGIEVQTTADPLESRSPFTRPARSPVGAVEAAAYAATSGAADEYGAVSAVMDWVASHVRYQLTRGEAQSPSAVLTRGSAYCTGIARLSVAMLEAVGIRAREVPGYVFGGLPDGRRSGFHRWVEVWYPDRGWVFSDPVASHNFVPATYLRLAKETLAEQPGEGRVLERRNGMRAVDLALDVPDDVRVRPNDGRRTSAALVVKLPGGKSGEAVLVGLDGDRRSVEIAAGEGRFLGLSVGRYDLTVSSAGRLRAHKALVFRAPVLAELLIRADAGSAVGGGE